MTEVVPQPQPSFSELGFFPFKQGQESMMQGHSQSCVLELGFFPFNFLLSRPALAEYIVALRTVLFALGFALVRVFLAFLLDLTE